MTPLTPQQQEMVERASEAIDEALEDVGSFVCESDRRIAASAVIDALRVVEMAKALAALDVWDRWWNYGRTAEQASQLRNALTQIGVHGALDASLGGILRSARSALGLSK